MATFSAGARPQAALAKREDAEGAKIEKFLVK
jgi:hypothetical protein